MRDLSGGARRPGASSCAHFAYPITPPSPALTATPARTVTQVLTSCAHVFCRECISGCLANAMGACPCPVCREVVHRNDLITLPRASRFSVDLDTAWRPSSKLCALMDDLRATLREPLPPPCVELPARSRSFAVRKVVVISQWTAMLDLVQRPLDDESIGYERLDGSLSQQQRSHALERFSDEPSVRVLLLSLRAGGVGLNLTAAQTVYLIDPWWNPAVEEQAIDRVHRIGQAYPVRVKRLLMQESVEDRIMLLQAKKTAMIKGTLGAADEDAKAMRLEDLKMLFSV